VGTTGPRDKAESILAARREIAAGHIVCIFAEGAISRTGNMRPFKRGMERIVEGTDVPIIPVHLDRLWGSIFSFEKGRFLWKLPRRIPCRVTVNFGKPLPHTAMSTPSTASSTKAARWPQRCSTGSSAKPGSSGPRCRDG